MNHKRHSYMQVMPQQMSNEGWMQGKGDFHTCCTCYCLSIFLGALDLVVTVVSNRAFGAPVRPGSIPVKFHLRKNEPRSFG